MFFYYLTRWMLESLRQICSCSHIHMILILCHIPTLFLSITFVLLAYLTSILTLGYFVVCCMFLQMSGIICGARRNVTIEIKFETAVPFHYSPFTQQARLQRLQY